ncbi:Putative nucleoside-diphosphate-sugar epimerase [Thioalkalivibrio nitratireducens DSM 14787]|uniref:Nucleoside-diphosphate-sugar epimerase n=1 Tax=Thioalkalivibrio nitratireducens (strain DSM 14787 / UNIQEM 213 / ALEN2) TaxID=1255043 RepID=L0DXJ0_THIND|nr:SDR family oxidoreductase [Thioalkalivibrio nitratireducens]AGA33722.1 Putative nucleoside-diphosphate-sugar epimerase [Thioalkalivibrio nitratireducens DSM 14787]
MSYRSGTGRPGRTLVFGASGYIGTHLVPRLLATGAPVRAAARSVAVLEARQWSGIELVEADALKPGTLAPALQGVDTAYYLVHSMGVGKRFGTIDREAAGNFARAAANAGVQRIVYLGGLVPPAADTEHIVSRRQTGDALRGGPVPVTEIRAGIIVGPGSAAFEVMRDLVFHLPVMLTPRWVHSKSPPIALDNLLNYLVHAPAIPEAAGRILDAAGPEYLSYADMMRILAEEAGRRPPWIIPVPVLTPRLSSWWLRLVTAVPTPIARALIEGMRQDFTADDSEIRRLIPQPLLGFREAVRAAFEAERRHTVAARWTEGAFQFRNYRPDYAYYAKRAGGSAYSEAPPQAVWDTLCRVGGRNRYFYMNGLWKLREALDWMVGGPGLNYGRRHPNELRVGDTVDSWRVIGIEPQRRLTLFFGMRAPGSGVLEFELVPEWSGTRIRATAYWHPAGVWGLLYWYALVPAHRFIFAGMTRAIARRSERQPRQDGDAPG